MIELKDIVEFLKSMGLWLIAVIGCIAIWVIIPCTLLLLVGMLLLFLYDVLGPVMGTLTALTLAIIVGAIIQEFT